MVKICINSNKYVETSLTNFEELVQHVTGLTSLESADFYLEQNGKLLQEKADEEYPIYVRIRILGGKGGFGSMLRAIGAQIEKTTNREACRDLSGRRLRDINEEKRLKAWLEKQGEREREAEERKKRKIEKLLAVPKHEFKDKEYEEARSKLTEKVGDAVEEGFKKAEACSSDLKRKNESSTSKQAVVAKKKKPGLWLDDDLSSGDDSDDSDDSDASENEDKKRKPSTEKFKASDDDSTNNEKLSDKDSNSLDSESVSVASK